MRARAVSGPEAVVARRAFAGNDARAVCGGFRRRSGAPRHESVEGERMRNGCVAAIRMGSTGFEALGMVGSACQVLRYYEVRHAWN